MASTALNQGAAGVLCPVIVGRDTELAQLRQAFHAAGQAVVISGSAGIGKSRLLREFAGWARAAGGTVVAGRCSPASADIPFRALREALLAAARTGLRPSSQLAPFLPVLASLVPEWGPAREAGSDGGGSIVVAEGLLRLLSEWSAAGVPAVLAIEDVHWSDRETVKVIEYLADNLAGHPVLLLMTLRDGEPGVGTGLIEALLARRVLHRVNLGPLDADQARLMLRACPSPVALPPNLIDVIVSRSDGIPFFIEEILATAIENSMSDNIVPSSISAAINTRLAALPAATAEFLRYAAVLGRQFDWHVVAAALGCPPPDALGRLRQAARAQLVDAGSGAFRFRHALTVETVESSMLPDERRVACAGLLTVLETLHPDLEGEICQLAAGLAAGAGDRARAADLWLEGARRAIAAGWLGSAEELARRAQADSPVDAERVLLKTWVLAGQPLRAMEAGRRILSSDVHPTLQVEVGFELVDAAIAAGGWEEAALHLQSLRSESGAARWAVGAAEVALNTNDSEAATAFARSALAAARDGDQPELTCRALWVIGRVERGRDTAAASAAFEEAHACAVRHGLGVARVKSLLELGTIDMYETLGTRRLDEARREALAAGMLATVAMIDLQLAAAYTCQGAAEPALAAAARSEDMSRRFFLASLPMSLALQAVTHGFSGDKAAMEAAAAAARAAQGDRETKEMILPGNGAALYHLGAGQLPEALSALDQAMTALRAAGGGAHPFPGRWALLRTVLDDGGAAARDECRLLDFDTAMSRATLRAADAVAAGREGRGEDAAAIFAEADRALARFEGGFLRSIALLLVAPCAHEDGWGEPTAWLREALANFDDLGLDNFAGQCRSALRDMGEPVPRRPRGDAPKIPASLAAVGVTAREAEVLARLTSGLTNRQIAEALHLSVRTVEKHVERLIMKTGRSRSELARTAQTATPPPAS